MNLHTLKQLNSLAILSMTLVGALAGAYINERTSVEPKQVESGVDGYYDPVNKVMCYWLKGSTATPACLVVDWPYEVGSGDEEYYQNMEELLPKAIPERSSYEF